MTQTPEPAPDPHEQSALADPLVPGALLDDDTLEELRLAEVAERQRLERRIARHDVTAVLVSHDGARWLPYSLTALADLTHPPHRVVAVDTGSNDSSRRFLVESLTEAGVLDRSRSLPFGAAVDQAVEAYVGAPGLPTPEVDAAPVEWLWLLHDDSAPEADALRYLLLAAERNPRAAVIGPKVRGWRDGRLLLELGVTVGRGGRRETWLEREETDQGQHDHRSEVLAVGSAGMLVRRDVWDELGGFDPAFVMFREDVDLCWRAWRAGHEVIVAPDAVIHHVEAATHGRRRTDAALGGRAHRSDRTSALLLLLANLPARSLPWTYLRLLVGSLLRALGLALAKAPGDAIDELVALVAVLGRPDRVVAARARRRDASVRPWSEIRPLLAPTGVHLRQALEAVVGLLSVGSAVRSAGGSALESGPTEEDGDAPPTGPGLLRRTLARPGAWLGLALVTVALVADRHLIGRGALQGGALLPSPAGAGDLVSRYLEAWHSIGVGSATTAPPYLAVLALPSWLAFGHVGLVVSVLMLLAVPLSGATAYVLAGRLTRRRGVRVWAAATYALLPAITGAVAAGRLGTAVLGWLLPLIVLTTLRALRLGSRWPVTWAAVLLLTTGVAFVPLLWLGAALLALIVLVIGAARRGIMSLWRGRGATARLLVLVAAPPPLLLPWSAGLARHPSRLFLEAGAPAASTVDAALPSWALALAQPGGPVPGSRWLLIGLVVAALSALLRPDRRRPVILGWALALVGLALAVTALVIRVPGANAGSAAVPWPGAATLLLGAGLVTAATVGGDGLRDRLATRTFGWRQPLSLVVALVAVLGTIASAAAWVARGADDPLTRGKASLLPPYIAASGAGPLHPRALLVSDDGQGHIAYTLQRGAGPVLGDAELAPTPAVDGGLALVVADLAAGVEDDAAAARLATYGVGSVVALRPLPLGLVATLDSTPGLERLASTRTTAQWQVAGMPGRARLVTPGSGARTLALTSSTSERLIADIPDGPGGRRVVLAEAASSRWHATLSGVTLQPLPGGWAESFTVPAGRGELVVSYDGSAHRHGLQLWALLVFAAVVLALPARRRRDEPDDDLPPEPLHASTHDGVVAVPA